MLSLVLATSLSLAADAGPPGVPWPPPAPPVTYETRAPLDVAKFKRRMTVARVGMGLGIAGPIFFIGGLLNLRHSWSTGLLLSTYGGFVASLAGPAMLMGGAQGAYNVLRDGGVKANFAPVILGWASLPFIPIFGIGWPVAMTAGAVQLRENDRAMDRAREAAAVTVGLAPTLIPGGAGLSLVVRL